MPRFACRLFPAARVVVRVSARCGGPANVLGAAWGRLMPGGKVVPWSYRPSIGSLADRERKV